MNRTQEETITEVEIAALQQRAWARTYRHALAHSPFYREHFRAVIGKRRAPIPLAELDCLPTLDKAVLSADPDRFLCVPPERIVDIVTTSGSTGKPLLYRLTESDLQRLALNEYLSFRCVGLTASDTVLLAVTLDRCFMAGMAYFLGLRALGCAVVRTGPATPLLTLEMVHQTRATAIVGVPSSLLLLADKVAEAGRDPATLGVRRLICIGESIRSDQFALNRAGALLAQRWGARLYSTYGITELASSLCECEAGHGGHLHPALLHLEAVDESGRPVRDGEVGELTATTFGVRAMPLIRYRTGDYAALHREPCSCGRRTLRIGPIVGRASQKLKFKGTTLFPITFKAVLEATPGIAAYVIQARSGPDGSDAVEVRLACSGEEESTLRTLRERFQGEARVLPQLILDTPAAIEAIQLPEGARKRRYFVDLRSEA